MSACTRRLNAFDTMSNESCLSASACETFQDGGGGAVKQTCPAKQARFRTFFTSMNSKHHIFAYLDRFSLSPVRLSQAHSQQQQTGKVKEVSCSKFVSSTTFRLVLPGDCLSIRFDDVV